MTNFPAQPPNSSRSRDGVSTSTSLPPFSQLEAVADGEYPPLSPMSFTLPEDVVVHDDS
jgi:meiosis induction protein kinase IME2/SME1